MVKSFELKTKQKQNRPLRQSVDTTEAASNRGLWARLLDNQQLANSKHGGIKKGLLSARPVSS